VLHRSYPFFYTEAQFGHLSRGIKKHLTSFEVKRFENNSRYTIFKHKSNEEILGEL
jgi:hypothetical protein